MELCPKHNKFRVNDNKCYGLINEYICLVINDYIIKAKETFKDFDKGDKIKHDNL